jgi:dienelactone hydrolase
MRKILAGLVLLALTGCAPSLDAVKPRLSQADSGTVWYATPGRIDRDPKTGVLSLSSEPVVLSGDLQFPPGRGPFPAVVLAHGCGGVGNADAGWAPVLRQWGYATFVIDSFRGRNLREVCSNAAALAATQRVPDVYGALRMIATHPRIDARRLALMGFSHGGQLTVAAATAWAQKQYLSADTLGFRAFLPFYPWCNTVYPEVQRLAAPMRVHSGALDDWTPAAPCAALVERARKAGQDASITVYPDAHHSFDNLAVPLRYNPNVENYAKCFWTARSVLGPFSGPDATTCRTRGATAGLNEQAVAQARRTVRAQLTELLR